MIEQNYHAEHDDSVESEVELGTQLDMEALESLRQRMEQGNVFNAIEETDSIPEEDDAHLISVIEDIDINQEHNSEDIPSQDE